MSDPTPMLANRLGLARSKKSVEPHVIGYKLGPSDLFSEFKLSPYSSATDGPGMAERAI